MQITLNQAELKDAVRSYLRTHKIDSDNIDMTFTATRGGAGIVTTITLDAEVCDVAKPDSVEGDTLDTDQTDDSVDTGTTNTGSEEQGDPQDDKVDDTGVDLGADSNNDTGASDKLFG